MNIYILAKRTIRALKESSVIEVYEEAIDLAYKQLSLGKEVYYIGVKDSNVIPYKLLEDLQEHNYILHTMDKMSYRGRAIDTELKNPITGRMMTGSSSGTAINVFKEINDIGIGTDGGGSILGPACSLNLYGFISPSLYRRHMEQNIKVSTDGIKFSPSLGFISKKILDMETIIFNTMGIEKKTVISDVLISIPRCMYHKEIYERVKSNINSNDIHLDYNSIDRRDMMEELSKIDFDSNILITFEGPVDIYGYGDSIIGNYDTYSSVIQESGNKYYLKVINMMSLSAFIVPTENLSTGLLFICKSDTDKIGETLTLINKVIVKRNELENKYFSI